MKLWKRKLKNELKNALPKLNDSVLNAPILSADGQVINSDNSKKNGGFSVRRLAFAISCLAVILAVSLTLIFTLPANAPAANVTAFSVEVNPSAMFTVGNDGRVVGVTATNSDADIILASDERVDEMVGKAPEDAVEIFLDYAARLGFVDFDDQGIVKLTVLEGGGLNLADAVKEYFKGKGGYFAVLESESKITEFCEKNGVSAQSSATELVEAVENIPRLFAEREVDGKTIDEIQKLYGERIEAGDYKDYYEAVITEYIDEIETRASDVESIAEIYNKIYESDESFFNDYWMIISLPNLVEYSEEFVALLKQMEEALADYAAKYGQEIQNAVDLSLLQEIYSKEKVSHVKALVEDFYGYFSTESLSIIENVFKEIGVELSFLTKLPDSKDEYLTQLGDIMPREYEHRAEKFKEDYNKSRARIGNDSYNQFIDGIIEAYGSLEEFWKKNKK